MSRVWIVVFAAGLLVCAAGCSDSETNNGQTDSTVGSPDEGDPQEDGTATPDPDEGTPSPDPGPTEPDTHVDTGPKPDPFPIVPCNSDSDCDSGHCVPSVEGMVCTITCYEQCPEGWDCRPIVKPGGDPVLVCIDLLATLCHPCDEHKDCNLDTAGANNLCLGAGDDGSFCGVLCGADGVACPEGYACEDRLDANGDPKPQCVPVDGECTCNGSAVALGADTTCYQTVDAGACSGTRTCGPFGLTECDAPEAQFEICNDLDDNCDGAVDEGLDSEPCEVTNNFGTCKGTRSCVDGDEACGAKVPTAETCNFIDDDCDGETDEGVASPCGTCSDVCVLEEGQGKKEAFDPDGDNIGGLVPDGEGGLTLDTSAYDLPFIWIANSAENTISKLNTETGCEVARYYGCANPSRTAVDLYRNGIIACRNDGGVMKVAILDVYCIDKNQNGSIDTSRDLDGNCQIDTSEMVANDECILWEVYPDGVGGCSDNQGCARAAGIDQNNNVWIGFWSSGTVRQLNGESGETMITHDVGFAPYGIAIDRQQMVWVATRAPFDGLGLVHPTDGVLNTWEAPLLEAYGLALDAWGKPWLAGGSTGGVMRFDPITEEWDVWPDLGLGYTRGVAVSIEAEAGPPDAGNQTVLYSTVYVAHHTWDSGCDADGQHRTISVFDAGAVEMQDPIDLGADRAPVGVAIDSQGFVWSVNQCESSATKLDPDTNTIIDTYPVGLGPYTYSDMTGYALNTVTANHGFLRNIYQGWPGSTTVWDEIVVVADMPEEAGAGIEVRWRVADTKDELLVTPWQGPLGPFPPATFPAKLGITGNWIEIELRLFATDPQDQPTLKSYTMIAHEQK